MNVPPISLADLEARIFDAFTAHFRAVEQWHAQLGQLCLDAGMPPQQVIMFIARLAERAMKQHAVDNGGKASDVSLEINGESASKPRLIPV